jgi:hypothetical protein
MIVIADRLPWELSVQQTGERELAKKKISFKSFMDLLETNQSLGLAPTGSAVQVRPTSPEILDAAIPEGRWGVTLAEVGDSALLPIILVVSFHWSTITILGE